MLQLNDEVKSLLLRLGETPENFTGRIIFMTMFNGISCGSRDNEKECLSNVILVTQCAKRFGRGQRTFIGPGSEKKSYSISEDSPQGIWIVSKSTQKAKVMENCRYTMQSLWKRLRQFFA